MTILNETPTPLILVKWPKFIMQALTLPLQGYVNCLDRVCISHISTGSATCTMTYMGIVKWHGYTNHTDKTCEYVTERLYQLGSKTKQLTQGDY